MKKYFSLLLFIFAFTFVEAQQTLVQNQDVVLQMSEVEYRVYRNASLQVKPVLDQHARTGLIELVIANEYGETQAVFESLKFTDCGEAGNLQNEKEFFAFLDLQNAFQAELASIAEQKECLLREKTRTTDKKQIERIENDFSKLDLREIDLREDERFTPENQVQAKYVYDLTYERFKNELLNGYELSEKGLALINSRVKYHYMEEDKRHPSGRMIRVGTVGSFFSQKRGK